MFSVSNSSAANALETNHKRWDFVFIFNILKGNYFRHFQTEDKYAGGGLCGEDLKSWN